jgi:hypothetical protein
VRKKKDGRFTGGLQFENRVDGTNLRIDKLTSLSSDGHNATFAGSGKLNRVPGSFTVTVSDGGKHDKDAWFSISISGGPTTEGRLRSGKIEIHTKKCSEKDHDGKDGDDDDDDDDDKGDDD